MTDRLAASLTPEQRELAARCALLAAMRFQRMGWEYGWRGNEHVPDAEALAQTIEELLTHQNASKDDASKCVASGRLMVDKRSNEAIDVYLHLGALYPDGTIDVDEEPNGLREVQ